MESHPQNLEFRNNRENFHPYAKAHGIFMWTVKTLTGLEEEQF